MQKIAVLLTFSLCGIATGQMKELPANAKAEVKGLCAETSCWQKKGSPKAALSRLSDHCPLVVELVDKDLD